MTRKEVLEFVKGVKEVAENTEVVEVLDKMIEQVSKKRTTKTPNQKANEEIVERIYDYIVAANGPVAIADIMEATGIASNQKASALVKKLVDTDRVVRAKDGKKTIYTLAD